MSTTSAVAVQDKKPFTIRDEVAGAAFKNAIAQVLPKHLTPDRMARVAIMAMTKTPKLSQCDRASFFSAMMTLSQLGLEPDGRRAHLIPYGTTCQLVIDYKGLVELAMRSGMVSSIHADVVCQNDKFSYKNGVIEHEPNLREDRGDVFAVYAIARFKDGEPKAEAMTLKEVDAIRKRSKSGNSGPWVTDWNEMAKKTVFRRLSKWLPLSPEFRDALDDDIEADHGFTIEDGTESIATQVASQPAPRRAPRVIEAVNEEPKTETAPTCDNDGGVN